MNVKVRGEFGAKNIKMWVIEVLVQDGDIVGPKTDQTYTYKQIHTEKIQLSDPYTLDDQENTLKWIGNADHTIVIHLTSGTSTYN